MAQQLRDPNSGRRRRYFTLALAFALGVFFGISGHIFISRLIKKRTPAYLEIRKGGYAFINPLIECESQEVIPELINFKNKIAEFVRAALQNKEALEISVYFRDLNNGPSFSVNENKKFLPASLLKVPIMMAYFKQAETDPSALKKTLTYPGGPPPDYIQYFQAGERLQPGQSYTIEELIRRMIVFSDNEASALLVANDTSTFNSVQKDLGIEYWEYDQMQGAMSDKSYASFFRVLFNASYLNSEMSEKALALLNESQFPFGLAAGVPAGIKISHKFGERHEKLVMQLHDCGIIYHPRRPYLLCIMTKGGDMETLSRIIQRISRLVYEAVEKHTPSL
ncbi:MAG: class A beta-lactamase-related serine hydrolase [Candidatus Omnitrophica bacterium]|nr:class A beta-lactamase-related serine hydrolase [Candidatus Omnitrophota bacterium]